MTKRYSRYGVGGNNGYSCRERFLALGVHSLEEQSGAAGVAGCHYAQDAWFDSHREHSLRLRRTAGAGRLQCTLCARLVSTQYHFRRSGTRRLTTTVTVADALKTARRGCVSDLGE